MISVTYDPADNKLRLRSSGRLDRETYDRVKAAGFAWAPKQDLFVAPMWTPAREDLAIELAGAIDDEDTTLVDRAEDRAERFEGYEESRAADAQAAHAAVAAIADNIPLGQPILVGHHSQKRAEKDAERIRSGMRTAIRLWDTSEYWRLRAAGALRHAKYKETPAVRHRRIKGLEADSRKHQRAIEDARRFLRAWHRDGLTHEQATAIANYDHHTVQEDGKSYRTSLWSMLSEGRMSAEQARDIAVDAHERAIGNATRWLAHLENRLTYERAMLDEAGGVVSDHHELEIGGRVLVRRFGGSEEWQTILRVNRTEGRVLSVRTTDRLVGVEEVKSYRAPEEGAAAAVKSATKLPPIVNYPSPGCREMTQAEWTQRAKHSSGFYRLVRIDATDAVGAHRRREAPIPGGGGWKTQPVYITDAKRVDPPAAKPRGAPVPELAREVVDRPARRRTPRAPNPADALREQLKAGVVAVAAPELFPSPPAVAELVVARADVAGRRVLEPSAGTGALAIEAIRQGAESVRVFEIDGRLYERLAVLRNGYDRLHLGGNIDFLTLGTTIRYERVVMNPPFSAEVEHVTHAFGLLEPGGRLVAVMSAGVKFRTERKYKSFRALVQAHGGKVVDLPEDAFRASGTAVRTVMVTIDQEK